MPIASHPPMHYLFTKRTSNHLNVVTVRVPNCPFTKWSNREGNDSLKIYRKTNKLTDSRKLKGKN